MNINLAMIKVPETKVITGGIIPGTSHLAVCELSQTFRKNKKVVTKLEMSIIHSGNPIHLKLKNNRIRDFYNLISDRMEMGMIPPSAYSPFFRDGETFMVHDGYGRRVQLSSDDIDYIRKTLEVFPVKCIYEI